jgi:hypothetical protein
MLQSNTTQVFRSPSPRRVLVPAVLAAAAGLLPAASSAHAGLRAYYNFNDAADAQAIADSSGNGNNGTRGADANAAGDDPATATNPPTPGGPVTYGTQLNFDGVDDFVSVPDSATLDVGSAATNDQFSIVGWVNVANHNSFNMIATKNPSNGSAANHAGNYELRIDAGSGNLNFLYEPAGGPANSSVTNISSGTPVPAGGWHHVAVTLEEGDGVRYYIDGVQAGGVFAAGLTNFGAANDQPLELGRRDDGFFFNGLMDDVALFDTELSAADIAGLANGTFTPDTIPEPSTIALGAVILGAVGLNGRRRRHV